MLDWIEAHPGLASWVQAVGTVAALLFAVLLPQIQRWRSERAASLAARNVVFKALAAMQAATEHMRRRARDAKTEETLADQLADGESALGAFPLHSLPMAAAFHFQEARDAYFGLRRAFVTSDMVPFFAIRAVVLKKLYEAAKKARGMINEGRMSVHKTAMDKALAEAATYAEAMAPGADSTEGERR